MSRKDYELIAWIIGQRYLHIRGNKLAALAREFADELEARNPRFDRQRFLTAACKNDNDALNIVM